MRRVFAEFPELTTDAEIEKIMAYDAMRQTVKAEHGQFFDQTSALLYRLDPEGIYLGGKDEYESEVTTILPRLKECHSQADVSRVVQEEFAISFGTVRPEGHYARIAAELWALWESSQRAT